MSVRARMKVTTVNELGSTVAVGMSAVYSSDPSDPNYSFSQATPSGQLTLNITNPAAFSQFTLGDTYDIDFTKVVETATEVPAAPAEPEPAPEPAGELTGTSTGIPTPPSAPAEAPSGSVETTDAAAPPADSPAPVTDGTVDPAAG